MDDIITHNCSNMKTDKRISEAVAEGILFVS